MPLFVFKGICNFLPHTLFFLSKKNDDQTPPMSPLSQPMLCFAAGPLSHCGSLSRPSPKVDHPPGEDASETWCSAPQGLAGVKAMAPLGESLFDTADRCGCQGEGDGKASKTTAYSMILVPPCLMTGRNFFCFFFSFFR